MASDLLFGFVQESTMRAMNLKITHCPNCGSDQIGKVCRDWVGIHKDQSYDVPELVFFECPVCGERVFDREAVRKIQAYSPSFAVPRGKAPKVDAPASANRKLTPVANQE